MVFEFPRLLKVFPQNSRPNGGGVMFSGI